MVMVSLRYLALIGRDSYGIPHTQGTWVLIEVSTLNELINYFQGLYQNANVLYSKVYILMKNNVI